VCLVGNVDRAIETQAHCTSAQAICAAVVRRTARSSIKSIKGDCLNGEAAASSVARAQKQRRRCCCCCCGCSGCCCLSCCRRCGGLAAAPPTTQRGSNNRGAYCVQDSMLLRRMVEAARCILRFLVLRSILLRMLRACWKWRELCTTWNYGLCETSDALQFKTRRQMWPVKLRPHPPPDAGYLPLARGAQLHHDTVFTSGTVTAKVILCLSTAGFSLACHWWLSGASAIAGQTGACRCCGST